MKIFTVLSLKISHSNLNFYVSVLFIMNLPFSTEIFTVAVSAIFVHTILSMYLAVYHIYIAVAYIYIHSPSFNTTK